jgi:small-conductance mechanosensitive channel
MNGCSNVKSEVLLGIWDKFHEHGIEIPYPQRDLHLRSISKESLIEMKTSKE